MGIIEDVRWFLDRLDAEGIPHMIVGGFALEAWGVPRATFDVDIQVQLPTPPAGPIVFGCIVEERTRDLVFGQDAVVLHRPSSTTPFEIFFTGHWLPRQAIERRVKATSFALERDVMLPTREDFILMKVAYMVAPSRRATKAAQDALDIERVIDAGPPLDIEYLRDNATRLGVEEALAPFLR